MEQPLFAPGQRWVSNTEPQLGLGILLEASHRQLTLSFPAAAEERCYSTQNPPLSRILYNPGDQISSHEGLRIQVHACLEHEGRVIYQGVDESGQAQALDEVELDSFVRFNKPQDRLFAGQVDKLSSFDLRADTLEQLHAHQRSSAYGLMGARVQLLPHQFYIAHQVSHRFAPRVLLADEVGLGKTIEAGLILHQQLFSGRIQRVLILVPDSLIHQWLVEMLRRFNLSFSILDAERCEQLANDTDNPFEAQQLVLCPMSELVNSSGMQGWASAAHWDMLVVDEAHHLSRSPGHVSPEYQLVEQLAQAATGLLLLTATPEQLGLESHFARLRLLDPDRYFDLDRLKDEENRFVAVNELVNRLLQLQHELASATPSAKVTEEISQARDIDARLVNWLGHDWLVDFDRDWQQQPERRAELLDEMISALLDRQGTGRVLFRNSRQAVSGFPERQLFVHALAAPAFYQQAASQLANQPSSPEQLSPQQQLQALLQPERLWPDADDGWLKADPRVAWMDTWLSGQQAETTPAKVLVICAQASTAVALEQHLRLRLGIRSAVFHEGLTLIARDRSAAYFADAEEGAQVLVCSEIGSEGRNFQFAHEMVLFDLPLNPDLLEQRIGRLDRIGQNRDVHIHVPVYEDSAQSQLLQWYHQGVDAFLSASPAGSTLFEQQQHQLLTELTEQSTHASDGATEHWQHWLAETQTAYRQLTERLEKGRNRLLELNSCRRERIDPVIDELIEFDTSRETSAYIERLLDELGVDQSTHSRHTSGVLKGSAQSLILQPGERMYHASLPGLPEDGLTATFSRNLALQRDDIALLTLEHPLVNAAMDTVISGELGNTAVGTLKLPPIKPGTLMLEALFTPLCPAPAAISKQLCIQQYLLQPTVRILVTAEGADISQALSRRQLSSLVKRVPVGQAIAVIKHARDDIKQLIEQAETLAMAAEQPFVSAALERMEQEHQQALLRLQSLAEINPNIRQEEIQALEQQGEQLRHYLAQTQLNLDALRVIIAT